MITFEHVSKRYPGGVAALQDVSFHLAPGEMVFLTGPSGAGKSTLASLIPRLYDVTSGAVLVDDVDVRDLTLTSLRRQIGVVAQDPHLFHESIGDNLRYARPDATTDELVEACRAARIHDTIAALPDGYDTVVGERGYKLSGGEKQRIALARVLLTDPRILILDEPTSSVDADTERRMQRALQEVRAGRTTFVIAHRIQSIMDADLILVLDRGRIVQRGVHEELMQQEGIYRRIYDMQARIEIELEKELASW